MKLNCGEVHILTMYNDVAYLTVIVMEAARCRKKSWTPGIYIGWMLYMKQDLKLLGGKYNVLPEK